MLRWWRRCRREERWVRRARSSFGGRPGGGCCDVGFAMFVVF